MRKSIIIICVVLMWEMAVIAQTQVESSDYQYALIEAVKQKNLGNIPGAIELYKIVIQEDDSVDIAHYELGTLYMMSNKPILAEEYLQRAYLLDPSNEWYLEAYIDILVILKKYDEAEKLISENISTVKDPLEYRFKSANIQFLNGNSKKAIRILDKIENKYGISEKVILLKAKIYEETKRNNKALSEIHKLIDISPNPDRYLLAAAELAAKTGQETQASEYYTRVFEYDSTNIYALTNLTDYYRKLGQHKKSFYFLKKSFENNFIEYERKMAILSYYLTDQYFIDYYSKDLGELITILLEMYPDKKDIKLYAVDHYIHERDYKKAFENIRPLITKENRDYEIWKQGILLANALSENKELLDLSTEAALLFPDSTEVIYFKGIAEFENGFYEEVVKTFSSEKITANINRELAAQMQQILAESYQKLEQYDKADSTFRRIIQENPKNYLVINNFSYYLALRKESLDEARRLSYQTILDNPENGTFLDTYAWVLYMSGEYEEAEKYINKALQKGGLNDPDVNEHVAEINLKLKSYHVAKSFFEKAIILGGDKKKLTERISYLETLYEK